jgi:pimeloyl-ACP methyl ester carboxylesterase
MPAVPIDDITINVETAGAGPPLVLIHGSFLNTLMWKPQLEGLTNDFRLILPDMRGHGSTPCPLTGRSFDRPRDVIGVLDGLGIERAFIGGFSMGGPIAMQAALDYPDRCLGLVLLATGPGAGDRPLKATLEMQAVAEAKARRLLELGTVEYYFTTAVSRAPGVKEFLENQENRRFFETILESNNPAWLAHWLRLGGCDVPPELESHLPSHRSRRLSKIRMPVLFLVGSLDVPFLPVAELLRSKLPQSSIEIIAGASHLLSIDSAEEVNRRIIRFAEECGSGI